MSQMAIYLYVQALSFRPRDFNTLCKLGSIEEKRDEPGAGNSCLRACGRDQTG